MAATREDEGAVVVLDADDGRTLARIRQPSMCLAWSLDSRWIVAGGLYGDIDLWDPATGRNAVTLRGHRAYVKGLAFSPDGRTLASASGDGDPRLWPASSR